MKYFLTAIPIFGLAITLFVEKNPKSINMKFRIFKITQALICIVFLTSCSHSIRFDGNGADDGIMPNDLIAPVTLPENAFIKNGYAFKYYNTKADGTGDTYKPNDFTKKGLKLYAQWIEKYKIVFKADGDKGKLLQNEEIIKGESLVLPKCSLTKKGYTCKGWKNGYATYSEGDEISIYSDSTFIPIWKEILNVNFNANGGKGKLPKNINVIEGEQITMPQSPLSKRGYTFLGWEKLFDKQLYKAGEEVVINKNCIFVAQWESNELIRIRENDKRAAKAVFQDVDYYHGMLKNGSLFMVISSLENEFSMAYNQLLGVRGYGSSSSLEASINQFRNYLIELNFCRNWSNWRLSNQSEYSIP